MNCPKCPDHPMVSYNRSNVEVDVCMNCLGVWLDRGEMEKILAETAPQAAADTVAGAPKEAAPAQEPKREWDSDNDCSEGKREWDSDRDCSEGRSKKKYSARHKKRKESFLERLGDVFEDVFDFD